MLSEKKVKKLKILINALLCLEKYQKFLKNIKVKILWGIKRGEERYTNDYQTQIHNGKWIIPGDKKAHFLEILYLKINRN